MNCIFCNSTALYIYKGKSLCRSHFTEQSKIEKVMNDEFEMVAKEIEGNIGIEP